MKTGERIKNLRQKLGLSVEELANKIGKNRATIYRYESNEIEDLPTSVLIPLSKALNTSPIYLLGLEEDNSTSFLNHNEITNSSVNVGCNYNFDEKTIVELNPDEKELLRIYQSLNLKGKTSLLNFAYELEEKQEKEI